MDLGVSGLASGFDWRSLVDQLSEVERSPQRLLLQEQTASYDPVNDRRSLTNKVTGDLGIGLEDISGNFLSATGLIGGTLMRAKNLEISINDGGTLTSTSNTITEDSSGIAGLGFTVLKTGEATVDVSSDTASIKKAITDFLDEFNKAQGLIDKETANTTNTTDSKGVVKAGTVDRLSRLGIDTNGDNNNLTLKDCEALEEALTNRLGGVAELFADETNGRASRLNEYLEATVGDDGALDQRIYGLGKQSTSIDQQIADMKRLVQANRQRMIDSFVKMEEAQAQINQQLQYLQRNLNL